jgi:hypothetical protein
VQLCRLGRSLFSNLCCFGMMIEWTGLVVGLLALVGAALVVELVRSFAGMLGIRRLVAQVVLESEVAS